ncbi:non-specific lipid-transfer protein 1-like [Actinidia eriantha]|uniref:non-specific lipid-transfer protein 1-like n=1 Tax=Actinidia eriantha TaxID=165200 RepID=UPI002590C484|nr:non-specific lipid-transfer protein 1-like [Actinidia eriantha]
MNHLIGFVAVLWLICGSLAIGAPPCGTMIQLLSPCLPYLMESSASPSEDCCNGVKDVAGFSKTKEDRSDICECIKSAEAMLVGIDTSRILPLPGKCGVIISPPSVSLDTDCSKV